jgi:hypothetical protein
LRERGRRNGRSSDEQDEREGEYAKHERPQGSGGEESYTAETGN